MHEGAKPPSRFAGRLSLAQDEVLGRAEFRRGCPGRDRRWSGVVRGAFSVDSDGSAFIGTQAEPHCKSSFEQEFMTLLKKLGADVCVWIESLPGRGPINNKPPQDSVLG